MYSASENSTDKYHRVLITTFPNAMNVCQWYAFNRNSFQARLTCGKNSCTIELKCSKEEANKQTEFCKGYLVGRTGAKV